MEDMPLLHHSTSHIQRGRMFSIEVGYFDTILEIKEKVNKYQGIPVSKQTFIFNGQVLKDEGDVWKCEILHNSRIQLVVAPDSNKPSIITTVKTEDTPSLSPTKIHLIVKSNSSKTHISLEIDVNDNVMRLKEKIHDTEGVSINRILLHAMGIELHDHQLLRDCDISDNFEINMNLRPLPTASAVVGGGGGGVSKKLKLMVLPKSGTKKIPVEVNASDNVGELRKELQKLNQRLQVHLPQEGYFFIYKQNVMDDDRSFRWHHVGHGDTIEIFNGSVSGGS